MGLRSIFISCLMLFSFCLKSQTPETGDCSFSTDLTVIDINNVSTTIQNSDVKWWDEVNQNYEIPKGSGIHSMYAGSIWIGGLDEDEQIHLAGGRYIKGDFYPGPISENDGNTDSDNCTDYDKLWVVYRSDVEDFIENYSDPSYEIPESILSWPAHGDESQGHAEYLAPFYDNNGDGLYNPEDGDYPAFNISGELTCEESLKGDVCVYWIMNDTGNEHENTEGLPLGVEVHCMMFAYTSNEDAVNNATFYDYRFINRSLNDYHDVYFAHWSDPDIGCANDDYVACDVERSMGYTYNGLAVDDDCGLQSGYGSNPPAIGVKILDAPWSMDEQVADHIKMSYFTYFINQSQASPTGDPVYAAEYYNYMRGVWKDGTSFVYGGNGHVGGGGDTDLPCRYMFPSESDQVNHWGTNGSAALPWSEETVSNPPGDRRMILSNGPFDLASGEEFRVTLAVPWARDLDDPDPKAAVYRLQEAADILQELHDDCYGEDVLNVVEYKANEIKCYPNPFSTQTYFKIDGYQGNYTLRVYDLYGKLVREQQGRQTGEIIFDRKGLAQGTYIYSIQVGDEARQTGKMVVMD